MSGKKGRNGLRAELASRRRQRDVAQTLRTGARAGWFGLRRIESLEQVLRRQHEKEVHNSRDEQEVYDGRDEGAVLDLAAVDVGDEVVEIGLADERAKERVDDVGGEGGDDGGKSCADDDGNGQVHYVAAENEVTETFTQGLLLLLIRLCVGA